MSTATFFAKMAGGCLGWRLYIKILYVWRFLAKLLHFYNPGVDNGFCTIKLTDSRARLYSSTGLLLIERILQLHSEEATRHLRSLLSDICHCLNEVCVTAPCICSQWIKDVANYVNLCLCKILIVTHSSCSLINIDDTTPMYFRISLLNLPFMASSGYTTHVAWLVFVVSFEYLGWGL